MATVDIGYIWLFLYPKAILLFPFFLLQCIFKACLSLLGYGDVPKVYYCRARPPPWLDAVLSHCKGLKNPFVPSWWVADGQLQSVLVGALPWKCRYCREYLAMEDGGQVALDWINVDDNEGGLGLHDQQRSVPVLIVLPGFSSNSSSVWPMICEGHRRGMRCVALNKRGHETDSVLSTPMLLSCSDTSDLRQVMSIIRQRFPRAPLVCVGYSAGSGLLCRYVNQFASDAYLSAAVMISPGYGTIKQLAASESPVLPWPYDAVLNHGQKMVLERHRQKMRSRIDVDAALQSRTINEFTELVYCPLYGFSNVRDYWEANNPMVNLRDTGVPVMCVSAEDDPVTPRSMIDFSIFEKFSSCMLVLTRSGGHCGFLEGTQLDHWDCRLACDFIEGVLCSRSHPH